MNFSSGDKNITNEKLILTKIITDKDFTDKV